MTTLDRYVDAIEQSRQEGAALELPFLSGFSGAKLLGVLQRLTAAAPEGSAYLEIGVYQGLSLVSVASANPTVPCVGVDNFAYFDPAHRNRATVLERAERAGASNVTLVDADFEDALDELDRRLSGRRIGVYFVDGPHDYRSQLMCLLLARPFLHPEAAIVIDDCNYAHVRQANRDFLRSHPEFKLLFESYTGTHPDNMSDDERARARRGFWNGVNVLVRDPAGRLRALEPPTLRSRELYENEHLVHGLRYAHLAPPTVEMLSFLRPFRPVRLFKRLARLRRDSATPTPYAKTPFAALNVHAEGCTERLNLPEPEEPG
jgi:predicted O-methyltransferase YrrM